MNGNYVSKQGGVLLNLTAYFGQYPGVICRANDEESLPDKHTGQQLPTNLHLAISLPPSLEFQQNGRDQFPILMPMDSRHRAPQGHFTRQSGRLPSFGLPILMARCSASSSFNGGLRSGPNPTVCT